MVISGMHTIADFLVEADAAAILTRLRAALGHRNSECYLVGGYIRDGLLGRASRDIDLTVAGDAVALAREVADALDARFVLLDEEHQVARVVLFQNEARWHLDFAATRGSIENDLNERDFTIDAIAAKLEPLSDGWNRIPLVDPLNGAFDLEQRMVRMVSDSAFFNDPARLLRAFRLAAELDFTIDSQTELLIQRDRELIEAVSGERIRDELCSILETDKAADSLQHLARLGILDLIIPEFSASRGVEQPKEHFWDVFDHSLETVAAVECLLLALTREGDLLDSLTFFANLEEHFSEEIVIGRTRKVLIKLAALLHDVAKPHTKKFDENGRMRFLGHAQQGAGITESILERLRFSSREIKMVSKMIEHHLRPGHLSNASELPTRRAIYRYFRDTAEVGMDILFLNLADHLATRGPTFEMAGWQEHVGVTQYMLNKWFEEKATVSPPKIIDGHDLIHEFGLEPGPMIGKLLEMAREAQALGEIETKEEALDFIGKELQRNDAAHR